MVQGVVDGAIGELHEYQDSWGFVQAARCRASQLAGSADPAIATAEPKRWPQLIPLPPPARRHPARGHRR